MAYKRKTHDEYEIQGDYGRGFECVCTEDNLRDARVQAACYRKNEHYPFKIVKKRVKNENT